MSSFNDGMSLIQIWYVLSQLCNVSYPIMICPLPMTVCPLSDYVSFSRENMSLIQIEDVLFQWWYVIQLRCILSQLWNVPYLIMICPVPMTVCPLCNAGHLVVYLSVDAVVVPEPSHCYLAAFQILPILWLPCIHLRRLWSVFHPTIINPLGCHLMVCTLSSYLYTNCVPPSYLSSCATVSLSNYVVFLTKLRFCCLGCGLSTKDLWYTTQVSAWCGPRKSSRCGSPFVANLWSVKECCHGTSAAWRPPVSVFPFIITWPVSFRAGAWPLSSCCCHLTSDISMKWATCDIKSFIVRCSPGLKRESRGGSELVILYTG
jgi:hypothetical protein